MPTPGEKVKITGDRHGRNSCLEIDEYIGRTGTVETNQSCGYWWVKLDGEQRSILLYQDEFTA
jgi:hypothetical protein